MQACKWYKWPYRNCTANMQVTIYCWGICIADCHADYIITYTYSDHTDHTGNMQATALQKGNWCSSHITGLGGQHAGRSVLQVIAPKYTAATLAYGRGLFIYFMHIYV